MTASKIFLCFCLFFILGIFLGSFFKIFLPVLLAFLILGIMLISVFWRYRTIAVVGFCILFLVLGIWRHQQIELGIINNENELKKINDLDQNITLIGIVAKEPDVREKSNKLTVKVNEILTEVEPLSIKGKVLVTTNRYPEYQYGDKLKITGKLESPKELEDFNYPGYLAKEGIYSVSYFPKIELLEREKYTGLTCVIYAKILEFKNKLRESIYRNLSPPQSSILGALILGDKSKMEGCSQKEIEAAKKEGKECRKLKEKLNVAGVRHITAVSGLHVAVLTTILMTLLKLLISFGINFSYLLPNCRK